MMIYLVKNYLRIVMGVKIILCLPLLLFSLKKEEIGEEGEEIGEEGEEIGEEEVEIGEEGGEIGE